MSTPPFDALSDLIDDSEEPAEEPAPAEPAADPAEYEAVEQALLARWPETRLDPTLDRITALCELMGDPQKTFETVHLTGTNGKTSTARMIETLVTARGLRTGRFTSPHVESMTERISLDGNQLTEDQFVRAYRDVELFLTSIDEESLHPVSFFEATVAMAYAAFADAPVDVAVVEVGMGGAWDATNVVDAAVAVIGPIAVDHASYLGDRAETIAAEKVGIIKPGARVVVAEQSDEVMAVITERALEVGATVLREGVDFGVVSHVPAVGGQMITLRGLHHEYAEVFLPLYGAHQAQNAALALAAVEALTGAHAQTTTDALSAELVTEAFEQVTSPGRLEIVRRGPTILLDAAHNPHGAAALVEAIRDSFTFDPLVGVVGLMADKDAESMLAELEPIFSEIVCTQNSTQRSMPADDLAEVARDLFGEHRVRVQANLGNALEQAVTLAETGGSQGESIGSGGVLVTGSVVTVGEARRLLRGNR